MCPIKITPGIFTVWFIGLIKDMLYRERQEERHMRTLDPRNWEVRKTILKCGNRQDISYLLGN